MLASKPAFQFLTVNEVDGVAVITFLESASMVEGDKVDSLAQELFGVIDTKKYKKILLNLYNAGYMSSANAGPIGSASSQDAGCQGESQTLLPAPTGHGGFQNQPVRPFIRDFHRRADSPQEVLIRHARVRGGLLPDQAALTLRGTMRPAFCMSNSPSSSWYSASVLTFQVSYRPRPRIFRAAKSAVIIE